MFIILKFDKQSMNHLPHPEWRRAVLPGTHVWGVCSFLRAGTWSTAHCFCSGSGGLKHPDNCSYAPGTPHLEEEHQDTFSMRKHALTNFSSRLN